MTLTIHDVRGRALWSLQRDVRVVGPQSETWQACDHSGRAVPRGIYLVTVSAGDAAASRKVLLARRP